ncbi:07dfcb61-dfbb-4004-bee6-acf7b4e9139d [Sclerotinia trifoliorum]|uniref:07dfcb61-dfbb-4004-bee6-acf7b4e9139d n=1 Tax=Sclerotinia trifoliorum TaxID=28548 RepID=A0A8H2W442_9HELO|nr:07dfcb61-dfbb-4004-bee6-acf7b4e9139d [Sclerotinia trifoliorum]
MDQWLRPVFTRTRTPVQSTPNDRSEDPHEAEETMKSIRPASRVSSYMGFRSSSTANLHTSDTFTFQHVNIPENVYHKPSGSQMAETLKVVMMTRNLMEPVPVEYNTCIVHVLEAYNDLEEELARKDGEIDDIKARHTKDIREFDVMAEQWKAKEKDYQKEMKNLEILLSKTEGGMENVTMARSKSVIHGARRAADFFEDGMEKIKQNFARYSSGRCSLNTTTEWEIDPTQQSTSPPAPETPRSPGRASRQEEDTQQERIVGSRRREHSSVQDTESFYSAVDSQPGSRLTSLQLDALERQHATEELGVAFDSSSESDDTSSRSAITEGQGLTPNGTPKHPDIKEKPLPDIPASDPEIDPSFSSETDHAQPWVNLQDDEHASSSIDSRKGFSFKAGDDLPSLLHESSKDILRKSNTVSVQASRLSYVMNNEDEFVAKPRLADSKFELKPESRIMEVKSSANLNVNTMLSGSSEKEKEIERGSEKGLRQQLGMGMGLGRGIERTYSSSSIVTAVRDNSGRSEGGRLGRGKGSGNGNGNGGGGGGRQKNGQATAVMAAVRAIAASNKSATANDKIQAHGNEFDRREGLPFSPERSPTGSQAGGGRSRE